MAVILALASPALAVNYTLLSGVEAAGAGQAYETRNAEFTVEVTFANSGGSVTALVVDLEGSIDGVVFYQLASHTLSAGELSANKAMFHVVNKRVRYVRGNITTLTETGTTSVTVKYLENPDGM